MCTKAVLHRLRQVFMEPKKMWPEVATESAGEGVSAVRWINGVAAISAFGATITMALILTKIVGTPGEAVCLQLIKTMISVFVLNLLFAWVVTFATHEMAPTFGGEKDLKAALKTVAYAITPLWLSGLLSIITALAIVSNGQHWYADASVASLWAIGSIIGSGYFVYMIIQALPITMKSPARKTLPYAMAVIFAALVARGLLFLSERGLTYLHLH